MQKPLENERTDALARALLSVKTREECLALLSDLCTMKEIQDLAQRIEVARLLKEGATYADIVRETGVSTATISRVNRALQYGSGGYEMILSRMEEQHG